MADSRVVSILAIVPSMHGALLEHVWLSASQLHQELTYYPMVIKYLMRLILSHYTWWKLLLVHMSIQEMWTTLGFNLASIKLITYHFRSHYTWDMYLILHGYYVINYYVISLGPSVTLCIQVFWVYMSSFYIISFNTKYVTWPYYFFIRSNSKIFSACSGVRNFKEDLTAEGLYFQE